jgi:putative peptidoglycan lipid II flippase
MPPSLRRSAAVVSAMTLLSRVSGLFQSVFLAHFLGAGAAADAFFVAFRLPNLLRRFTAEGTMTAAFIPTLAEIEGKQGEQAMKDAAARFLGTLTIVLAAFTVLAIVAMNAIVGVLVLGRLRPEAGWGERVATLAAVLAGHVPAPPEMALTAHLSRIMFPYLVLVSVTAGLSALLNLRDRFALPASVSTFWNLSFIAFAWAAIRVTRASEAAPEQLAAICALAVLAGGVVQLALLWPAARALGFGMSLGWHFRDPAVRRTLRRMGPGLLAAGIYPINLLISTMLASDLRPGAQTVLFNSNMMGEMVLGVFAMSLATASLPLLSRQAQAGDLDGLRASLSEALRSAALLAIPASFGMAILAQPIVTLIFETGRYGPEATAWTARTLVFQCAGLLFAASQRIATQALYALKDYRGPAISAAVALVSNVALSLVLLRPLETRGLALATGLASFMGMCWLSVLLDRRLGHWPKGDIVRGWARMALAAAVMAVATAALSRWLHLSEIHARVALGVRLFPLIGVSALLYAGCLLALRDEEALLVWARARKVLAGAR